MKKSIQTNMNSSSNMFQNNVVKRDGSVQEISFDKIYNRIKYLVNEPFPLKHVNASHIAQVTITGLYDGITTSEIDTYSAQIATSLSIKNYDYSVLAGRLAVSNHHKNTLTSFKDKVDMLYVWTDKAGNKHGLLSPAFYKFVKKNQSAIESHIDYSRDYLMDYYGHKTLEQSYLLKIDGKIIERPQDMFMRVAIGIHGTASQALAECSDTLKRVFETYDAMSLKYMTHATPTLFNSGLRKAGLLSCFLLGVEDSIPGIMKAATDCALISKWSGGIGYHISNIRSKGSYIKGTGGSTSGIVPFMKIFNEVARAVNQGGKRLGRFATYLEPHHADIVSFLEVRRNHGDETMKTRDLFISLWISDLFMERVRDNQDWTVFDPNVCPGLSDTHGEEYRALYLKYESEGKGANTYKARDIWNMVFMSQKESGVPYICYKDAVNRSNNQSNIGIIKSSNLCTEIMEYSSDTEYACCCLSSICLTKFVIDSAGVSDEFPEQPVFDFKKFTEIVEMAVRNLNKVIDTTMYPVPEAKTSNMLHRPIGIGVQGLADVFLKFNTTFDAPHAKKLNKIIFETLYYAAATASSKMCREEYLAYYTTCQTEGSVTIPLYSKKNGKLVLTKTVFENPDDIPHHVAAYSSFKGSPLSKGIYHFEMMGMKPDDLETSYDWETLRAHITKFGVKNSLLVALMPTVSTSRIMGNVECFEGITSNVFKNQTLAGEFLYVNKYLMNDLNKLGLWDENIENQIKRYNGSIQMIEEIPKEIRYKYRTIWEISQKDIIQQAVDRQPFVDQAQSLNLYIENLSLSKFTNMNFYGWKNGLKTGCYYLRSRAATTAQKITVSIDTPANVPEIENNADECLMCSS